MTHSLADSLSIAAVVTGRVLSGGSLNQAMGEVRVSGPLRAAAQDLSFSALRSYGRANAALDELLKKPPTPSLRGLLLAAITELEKKPVNPHAIVHQAVEAAARVAPRNATGAKGLVNAVLRNYLRRESEFSARALTTEPGRHRHPQWWIDRVRTAWPKDWESILETANAPPPMTLRVNVRHTGAPAYLELLQQHGIKARYLASQAIRLERSQPVERLPGFADGWVSVQDWGAQQAATLLDVEPGMRVLDACAAPGGKTAHILEQVVCKLVASDIDAPRLQRVEETLQRLKLNATYVLDDAARPIKIADDAPYDRILADVPCSASGVVRRHPDIKWLRRASDMAGFQAAQRDLLDSLWRLLAPGGKLLYATCSVFPEENALQVETFLDRHADAARLPLPEMDAGLARPLNAAGQGPELSPLSESSKGQLLPGPDNDGFFYALLEKRR